MQHTSKNVASLSIFAQFHSIRTFAHRPLATEGLRLKIKVRVPLSGYIFNFKGKF